MNRILLAAGGAVAAAVLTLSACSSSSGGGTGSFTAPTTPGSYPFGCTYHPEMAGMLVVKA